MGVELYANPQDLSASMLLAADNTLLRVGQLYVRPGLVGMFGGPAPSSSSSSSGSPSSSSSGSPSSSSSGRSSSSSSGSPSSSSSGVSSSSSGGSSSSSSAGSSSSSSGGGGTYPTSGLLLYLDSRMGTGVSVGSPVTTWQDQSGNGNNALAFSGNANLTASVFGSQPAVQFGSGISMSIPYVSAFALSAITTAYVIQYNTGTAGFQNFFARRAFGGTVTNWQSGFSPSGGSQYDEFNGIRIISDPTSLANGDQRIFLMTGDSGSTTLYRNTSVINSDTNAFFAFTAFTNDISIGDSSLGGTEYFYGAIGAIMMWDHILNSTERAQVVSYLNGAFGVP